MANKMQFVAADFKFIPGSNTFRAGRKYAILTPGSKIEAVDGEDVLMGVLTVKSVHIMHAEQAFSTQETYTVDNHFIAETNPMPPYFALTDEYQPERDLKALISGIYGPKAVEDDALITVIYFA